MIKLTYNGFVIEVDSVASVKEIISSIKTVPVEPLKTAKKPGRPVGSVNRKKKYHHKARWLADEMNAIFTALDNHAERLEISKYPPLRERHSKNAIAQMVKKVVNNSEHSSMSADIANMIREYHAGKTTHLVVKTY